jgi:hypothetical protein
VNEAFEPVAEHLLARAADHSPDRFAHVATALAPEHEHEIGRGGDQAAEVRRLPASCGDEPEREEHGGDEASETEDELGRDQVGDVPVGAGGDRVRGIEGDVRSHRRQDAQPLDRIDGTEVLARRQADRRDGPVREVGGPGRRQVMNETALLHQLEPCCPAAGRRELYVVVVSVHGGRLAAVEQDVRAFLEQPAGQGRVGRLPASHEQHLGDVALGKRALPRGHLDDSRLVARAPGCPPRERDAHRGDEGERDQDRRDRAPATSLERAEVLHLTTTCACMPLR